MLIVGIDPHSRSHVAAAIDEQGRLAGGIEVDAGACGLAQLTAWIETLPQPRLVAIENARGYGLAIVRLLLAGGEELVDVPATLTCAGRRSSGQRGKHDQGDALVIARIALRDRERLPRLDQTVLDDELKLLTDARDQLIVEAGRWRNRTHALLRAAAPGYQERQVLSPRPEASAEPARSRSRLLSTIPSAAGWLSRRSTV
jgi:transposase